MYFRNLLNSLTETFEQIFTWSGAQGFKLENCNIIAKTL